MKREIYIYLPSEEMQGRIIGREGRNARCFEEETGAKLDIKDGRWMIIKGENNDKEISKVARVMFNLIKDGRIHPERIKEEMEKMFRDDDEEKQEKQGKIIEMTKEGIKTYLWKRKEILKERYERNQNE